MYFSVFPEKYIYIYIDNINFLRCLLEVYVICVLNIYIFYIES